METGDSNFSQPPSNFILLASQDDTQQHSQAEDQMRHILTTLPALQPPQGPTRQTPASLLTDLGEISTEEETKKEVPKVLVMDSEMEMSNFERKLTETSDATVSETMEESDENVNVTVIEKKTEEESDLIADTEVTVSSPASPVEPDHSGREDVLHGNESRSQSSSQNESSFQSKDRSNLGSYDQCEVYGTQKGGHAHGQRFKLFQSSQDDVFGDSGDEDGDYVSTPAEHIGSLQLSAKPMLVPETVDEMESEVPLTPPHMIPASPTDQEQTEEESVYNVNAANTLADCSKGFNYSSSSGSSKGSGDKTVIERHPTPSSELEEPERVTPVEDQEFLVRPGPTLAGDIMQQEAEDAESLHLHLSASHPSVGSCNPQIISPERNSESPEIIEYVTETPKKRPPAKAVTSETQPKLTEDQSESRIIRISTPKMKTTSVLPKEVTKTPEDVIIINSGSGDVVVEDEEEQLSLHLSPSQGEVTQSSRSKQIMSCTSKTSKGKKSHRPKRDIDAPLVVWKDNEVSEFPLKDPEKDIPVRNQGETEMSKVSGIMETGKSSSGDRLSDEFHLTLPKGGDLLHPAAEKVVTMETEQNRRDEIKQPSKERKPVESENIVEESVDRPKSPTLTMSMIHADSEPASEGVFKLEKPEILPTTIEASEENQQEDIFKRAEVKQPRKHWKYVQEEDSDEEYISPRQPDAISPSVSSAILEAEALETTETGKTGENIIPEQQVEPLMPQPEEAADNTMSYDVNNVDSSGRMTEGHKSVTVQQETEMEVLEAFPLELADGKSSVTAESTVEGSELEKPMKTDSIETTVEKSQSAVMRPPSTPIMSQDRASTLDRPKTPASVQNILQAYSDIIYKKTPLRQRSASVDITQQGSDVRTSLSRQFSHDVSVSQSGRITLPHSKDQSQKLSQLVIQTQPSVSNGASIPKGGCLSPKGGSASPKGGSASPKGGSWMSSRKPSSELLPDAELKEKKSGSSSPSSNPPKSPKGLDIADISHELLQSFRQSKKNRHHSGNHGNGNSSNRNGNHGNGSVHNTSSNGNKSVHLNNGGSHGDKRNVHVNGSGAHPEGKTLPNNGSKTMTSAGLTPSKTILSSPPGKQLSTPKTTGACTVTMSPKPVGVENQNVMPAVGNQEKGQNRTPLPKADTVISVHKSPPAGTYTGIKSAKKKEKLQKSKKLLSSAERMRRKTSVDSATSVQMTSGPFVSSTQKFLQKETSIEPLSTTSGTQSLDPFIFHSSQSQREMRSAPRLRKYTSSSFERTPVSTRKRRKVTHKLSGVKKKKIMDNGNQKNKGQKTKGSGPAETVQSPTSLSSDVTVTTVGSLQSIPSTIGHVSSAGEPGLSSPGSSRKNSTGSGSTSQRRLSIEPLPDTLQLHSEDDNYQRVTIVTKVIKRYIMETETERQVIGSQGQILESNTTVQKGDPVIVEEKTHKKVQVIYMPSPSRSVSSLTSGDLADVSSSLSKSGSSSLGSKVSSFEQSQKSPDHTQSQRRLERSDSNKSQGQKEAVQQKTSEFLEPQPSTSRQPYELLRKDTLKSKPDTPELSMKPPSTGVTPIVPSSVAIPSDTEGSDVGTPLGSTINKTGSYLHSRSVSVESPRPVEVSKNKSSPKASDSLFSSTEEKGGNQVEIQKRRSSSGTSDSSLIPAGQKRLSKQPIQTEAEKSKTSAGEATSSSDQISPEIPYQDEAVSSSGTLEKTALIPSTGEPGSRILAKWKDGFYYPGAVKGKDRYGRFQVRFDDGDSMTVKTSDLLLVEKLPVGQSILVQTKDGDFESGLIVQQQQSEYMVETDSGSRGLYSQSQVILTADQASCLIADKGSEIMLEVPEQQHHHPVNVGDVSLDNLLDAPRRSAKKAPPPETKVTEEDKGQVQGSRGRKRKLEPQATSTPTPKGKQDSASPKKRKTSSSAGFIQSPLLEATSSPMSARRTPRKARVGLFNEDLGPIPGKKIFRGVLFLLTNVDKTAEQRKQEKQLLQDSSLETSTDESPMEEEMMVPFDKNQLKAQIEAGGGKILDNFDVEKIEASKKCYLLSSAYQRTIKYLQCLACGVICVSHSWVINSCKEDKLLDHKSYILPAGISLEKKKVMESKSKGDVLIGLTAFVSSKNSKFCECWSEILRLAKCTVLQKLQYSKLDVIVTDSSCTQATVRQAETHGIPLVSTEWVIQSLINGKAVKYDGHPRYQYDFII